MFMLHLYLFIYIFKFYLFIIYVSMYVCMHLSIISDFIIAGFCILAFYTCTCIFLQRNTPVLQRVENVWEFISFWMALS